MEEEIQKVYVNCGDQKRPECTADLADIWLIKVSDLGDLGSSASDEEGFSSV